MLDGLQDVGKGVVCVPLVLGVGGCVCRRCSSVLYS